MGVETDVSMPEPDADDAELSAAEDGVGCNIVDGDDPVDPPRRAAKGFTAALVLGAAAVV